MKSGEITCFSPLVDHLQIPLEASETIPNSGVEKGVVIFPPVKPFMVGAWTAYEFPIGLSAISAVYILTLGGRPVYVGQTTNLVSRISAHLCEKINLFDGAIFIPTVPSALLKREAKLIRELGTPLNGTRCAAWPSWLVERLRAIPLADLKKMASRWSWKDKEFWDAQISSRRRPRNPRPSALASSLRRPRGAGKGKRQ